MTFQTEPADPNDPPLDFCLWPYTPTSPVRGLRGVNLLYAAAEQAGAAADYQALATSLRKGLGPFRSVWGVKWDGAALSSEFYFYDYERLERRHGFAAIASAFAPHAQVTAPVDDRLPYFMASLELPMRAGGFPAAVPLADIYIGNPGSQVSSGISYQVGQGLAEMKNFYFFFDTKTEWDSAMTKAACSATVPLADFDPDEIFPGWLRDCRVVVVANKRRHDAAYFSGIGIGQLIAFLKHFAYPAGLIAYAEREAGNLAHLSFDVGFDYRREAGQLVTAKSSFYNVL